MRLLYLYPEEWTGRRAREMHTLCTCVALAQGGCDVTLVTAGGLHQMQHQLRDVAGRDEEPGLHLVALSRSIGPIRSAAIFDFHFRSWLGRGTRFEAGFVIHLKAADMLRHAQVPYLYEAHEIFAETPQTDGSRQRLLHELEKHVLTSATWRVATSKALATALVSRYALLNNFAIVPNAGSAPLAKSVAAAEGPMVYCGSIAGWKGLDIVIVSSRAAKVPLKIVGGTEADWRRLSGQVETSHVTWHPRVPLAGMPEVLANSRAGVVPTQPETPSGRYSCPMKLFDYARCGLPVLSTALPSLLSLDVGSWCTQVESSGLDAWTEAMRNFRSHPAQAETARAWAGAHTWKARAASLMRVLATK